MIKKNIFMVFVIMLFVMFTVLTGCGGGQNPNDYNSTGSETPADTNASEQKTFTPAELATYNGKDGKPAYIAIDGKVYDVSAVPQWKNGNHAGQFEAGKDFTDELKTLAPHSASLLQGVPVVGVLSE